MTYIHAELHVAGQTYPLAACTFGFHQYTDSRCVHQYVHLVPSFEDATHQCLLVLSAQQVK